MAEKRKTITRSELLARLRECRAVFAQWAELSELIEDPKAQLTVEQMQAKHRGTMQRQIDDLYDRLMRLQARLTPGGTMVSLELLDFCIKAIETRRATSMRKALHLYEDWSERQDAERREDARHRQAMDEARRNAEYIASNAAMDQAMSDFLKRM